MRSAGRAFADETGSRRARAPEPGAHSPEDAEVEPDGRALAPEDAELDAFARAAMKRAAELGRRLGIPEHAAEEILQECLVRLWQERDRLDRSWWEGWLWKAMHFRRLKYFRAARGAAKHQQELARSSGELPEGERPDASLHLAQCERDLRALVGALDPVRREVVRLYLLEDMPMAEVAVELGIPENTAKHHWHIAKREMRAAWERDRARECSRIRLAELFAGRHGQLHGR